jgi:hypothetical protein
MIRHENDVTNHRLMWLLIRSRLDRQTRISPPARIRAGVVTALAIVGILVTLSAFAILYKSYQARGYLHFLGRGGQAGNLAGGTAAPGGLADEKNQRLAEETSGFARGSGSSMNCWSRIFSCPLLSFWPGSFSLMRKWFALKVEISSPAWHS